MKNKFYKQKHQATCGIAVIRTVLENKFDIAKSENNLIKLVERLYKENNGKNNEEYRIKHNGTKVYHFKNFAKHFGLGIFINAHGNISQLKYFIDNGFWPVVYRGFELDNEGHYILVYNYNHSIEFFDPIHECGGLKKESYRKFNRKWYFEREKWYAVFYNKDKLKIPFK